MTKIRWHEGTASHMQIKENKGVTWLTYPAFEQFTDIVHGFSTRLGGVSEGIYASMNLSFTRGDEDAAVHENYRRFAAALGFSEKDIVTSDQTHTANVRIITEEDRGNGITKPRPYTDVDGMITNVRGLVLATFYADCVPLYFVDPVHHAIGCSHSGWRGTVGEMGKKTVEAMREAYGSRPEDIFAAIGPSICQDCYEVGKDVAEPFEKLFSQERYQDVSLKNILTEKVNGKYQLDLWRANEAILLGAGILKEHLSMTDICTCCNPSYLFSHRASKGKRGNLAAFLMLKQ